MKKLLTALLCGTALVLSADVLKEWKFEEGKVAGVSYPKKHIAFRVSPDVKTPDGAACGEFSVKVPGDAKVPWSVQIGFNSKQKITKSGRYRCSFQIRADRKAKLGATCNQGQAPWKTVGNSYKVIELSTDWKTILMEFDSNMDYEGPLRSPMLMVGALPEGTILWVSPVSFEQTASQK